MLARGFQEIENGRGSAASLENESPADAWAAHRRGWFVVPAAATTWALRDGCLALAYAVARARITSSASFRNSVSVRSFLVPSEYFFTDAVIFSASSSLAS